LAEKALAKGMKDARDEIVRDRTTLLPPFGRRKSFKAIHREPFSGFAKVPKG
jgi:hypothetical protein